MPYHIMVVVLALFKAGVNKVRIIAALRALELKYFKNHDLKEVKEDVDIIIKMGRLLYDGQTILLKMADGSYVLQDSPGPAVDLDYSKLPVFQAMEVKKVIDEWK